MTSAIDVYRQFLPNLKKVSETEWKTHCPYPDHEDSSPSFYVNETNGLFFCHGCSRGGNVKTFLNLIGRADLADEIHKQEEIISSVSFTETISPAVVEQLHKNLLSDTNQLSYVLRQRRLSFFVVKKFLIGYDTSSDRIAFPIKSRSGKFVNIKLHNSHKNPKSLSWHSGAGKPRLYPFQSLLKNSITICEGEFDCLLLHSMQINAITSTAGAGTWEENWNEYFQDKYVKIVLDNDDAGKKGADKIAFNLASYAKKIEIIELPSVKDGKTDVTDFIKAGGDIHKLLSEKRR